jgi:hypothetical protein
VVVIIDPRPGQRAICVMDAAGLEHMGLRGESLTRDFEIVAAQESKKRKRSYWQIQFKPSLIA